MKRERTLGDELAHHLRLNFGFGEVSPSREKALEELASFIGRQSRGSWFVDLLKYLSSIRDRFKVSDLHLIEGREPFASRPLVPLTVPPLVKRGISKIERVDLSALGRAFLNIPTDTELLELAARSEGGVNFSFAVYGLGVFRCNLSLYQGGLSLAVRWLDFVVPDFDFLSYPPKYREFIENLITVVPGKTPLTERETEFGVLKRGGLILHCGATGSGKTTSIAAEIDRIAQDLNGVVITYENPVEYRFLLTKAPVVQYDVGFSFGGSWDGVLKHLLRNTPSVALIGEVRSGEEIAALVDIASRGHLIFSTMHAGSIAEALEVLFSKSEIMGSQLASALLAVVAHRLTIDRAEDGSVIVKPSYEYLIVHPEGILPGYSRSVALLQAIKNKDTTKFHSLLTELKNRGLYQPFESYRWVRPRPVPVRLEREEVEETLSLIKTLSLRAGDFRTAVQIALSYAAKEEKQRIKRLIDFYRAVISGLEKVPYSIEELYLKV